MNWRYLWKIVGLLLAILGIVGGKAILELYARQSIVLPEEVFSFVPEFIGLVYCLLILISGIVLFGGWSWHRFPSMKVLLIFAVINGIIAIFLGYLYGHSKISVDYGRFAGENDLVWITVLIIVGIGIVIFTWIPIFIQYYSDLRNKSINKMIISGIAFAIFCILLVGFVFPLFFDEVARNFTDHNLKVAVRQNIDKKFGFVSSSDLEKITTFNAGKSLDSTALDWTSLSPNMRTTIISIENNDIANLEGIGNCTNLETLNLGNNMWLEDITPLKDLHHLTKLNLNGNVKDITPLSGLTQLTYLDLWGTHNLKDIKPLENLTKLSVFIAYGCAIEDVSPLKGLTNLNWLNLNQNRIIDISPLAKNTGLSKGDKIDLRYNPLDDISINIYIPQLRERGVEVQWEPSRRNR